MRIVLITTVPDAMLAFLSPHVRTLSEHGNEVHTIASPVAKERSRLKALGSTHHEIPMKRTISPLADMVSLVRLWRLLRRIRPDVLQTHTPKAGLLGMMAGYFARVPVRLYTVNGLPGAVTDGPGRGMVACAEWLSCAAATRVFCVSRSVRRYLLRNHFCCSAKCRVLGDGGSHGVDLERFDPGRCGRDVRYRIRREYSIPHEAKVIGYVGRMVPAKGVRELLKAWTVVREACSDAYLLLCGYLENDHPLPERLIDDVRADPRIRFTERKIFDMPPIYAACDVNVLPSYCEGLPNVVLEAAAMGIPTVAARVPGCVDAIRHGVTGLLVTPRSPESLAQGVIRLTCNFDERRRMGIAARDYVARRFSEPRVTELWLAEYDAAFASALGEGRSARSHTPSTVRTN